MRRQLERQGIAAGQVGGRLLSSVHSSSPWANALSGLQLQGEASRAAQLYAKPAQPCRCTRRVGLQQEPEEQEEQEEEEDEEVEQQQRVQQQEQDEQ